MLFLCPSCPVLLSCSQSAYSILTHLFILCGLRSLADRMSQVLRRCKNRCHTQRLVLLRSSTIHAAQLHRMRPHTQGHRRSSRLYFLRPSMFCYALACVKKSSSFLESIAAQAYAHAQAILPKKRFFSSSKRKSVL
jgi:hypothetical protein